MGHSEDYLALVRAQGRYREESNKACSVLESTAPVNPTARATPHALEPRTAADLQKRIDELMAKSSPIAASTAVTTSPAEDSTTRMPTEPPAYATHFILDAKTTPP